MSLLVLAIKKLSHRDPEASAYNGHGHGMISVPVYGANHSLRVHAVLFGKAGSIYLVEVDQRPDHVFQRPAISQKLKSLYVSVQFHFPL